MPDTPSFLCDLLETTLDRLEQACDSAGAPRTISTGFRDVDRFLGGTEPASLLIVGARPSTGTTAFALDVARHVATSGRPVLVFSLELDRDEVALRMLAQHAHVETSRIRTGQLRQCDWDGVIKAIGQLGETPVWVDDDPAISVSKMRAHATHFLGRIGDLGLIVVDCLQLMSSSVPPQRRQTELASITRDLKVLASQLDTPVLAILHLGNDLESRDDKRPVLTDLSEFGPIERDAEAVMFLYRDEMYDPASSDQGIAEVIIAKNRNGPTGTLRLGFSPASATFADATSLVV